MASFNHVGYMQAHFSFTSTVSLLDEKNGNDLLLIQMKLASKLSIMLTTAINSIHLSYSSRKNTIRIVIDTIKYTEKDPYFPPEKLRSNGRNSLMDSSSYDVEQFRKRMAPVLDKYPSYDTMFTLERWLRSYDSDIEEAAKRMTRALQNLNSLHACRNYDSFESLNDFLHTINRAVDYLPGGIMGPDKHGNIIIVQPMGRARPKTMMRLGRVSDLYRASVLEAEACMYFLRKEEAIRGRQLSIVFISDLAELSIETIYMPAVKAYMNVLNVLQEMIGNVEFIGSDWKQRLKDELGEENIFRYWGGTKEASTETGTIRMGGEVPDTSGTLNIPVYVPRPNSSLQWYFTINDGDVDFKITYNEEEEVWPLFRLSTEFVPEYGELLCLQKGIYVLHFDNPAKLFNKIVTYNILVKDP
ncbi:Sec14-like protein 4 [Dirofilaria immitis]|nr:Sec14-like protein 4 [Dirofilaria immitis]